MRFEPRPGFIARGDARGHGPRKGKWKEVELLTTSLSAPRRMYTKWSAVGGVTVAWITGSAMRPCHIACVSGVRGM